MAKHRSSSGSRIVGSLTSVIALVAGMLVYVTTTAPAPEAQAATINVGAVKARVTDHIGTESNFTTPDGTDSSNCIKYSPAASGGAAATSYVTSTSSPSEAITAHGYGGNNCPSSLNTGTQSAVGLRPAAGGNVTIGAPFVLGRVIHYNNPVRVDADYFTGKLDLELPGFTTPNTVGFNWTMWESPNSEETCPTGYRGGDLSGGGYNCLDEIKFQSQISNTTLVKDGISYRVVINGFDKVGNSESCPSSPTANSTNQFLTNERAQTHACLWATLTQVRNLKIVKKFDTSAGTPAGTPTFAYTSTSNLAGSPWQAPGAFNLGNNGETTKEILQGETVSVTETMPSDDRWALTGVVCRDGANNTLPANVLSIVGGKVTITNLPAAETAAASTITCTYTNKYTPKNTLTLAKTVDNGSATPADFTLTATGPTPISGTGTSAAIVNQRVLAGTYVLSETNSGAAAGGYTQNGNWVCTNQSGGNVTVTGGNTVVIPDSGSVTSVTCKVRNRFVVGSLQITKVIDDPVGGYIGGTAKTYSGTYNCGAGYSGTFNTLRTDAPVVIPNIPLGRVCSVTENTPTGGLLNASYAWGTPTIAPATVTIGDGTTSTITITNKVVQNKGNFLITKVIDGPGGYTGGNRTFPLAYSCTLSNGPTITGTVNISTAGAVSAPSNIPTGSVCTFTETLAVQPGDFTNPATSLNDPSYSWTGYTVTPTQVTIGNNTVDPSVAVTIKNTYTRNFGSLKITKAVSGSGYVGTGTPFAITYNCGGTFTGTVNLSSTGTTTINNLPAGATCSLSEAAPNENLLDAAHDWGTPTWAPSNQVTIGVGTTVSATVTNPTVAVFGKVTVTKALSGATGGVVSGKTFDITVACTNGFSQTFPVTVGGNASTPNLPVGTSCTITEAAPSGGMVDDSYGWGTTPAPQTVSVTSSGQIVSVTVTNPVVRKYGSLSITKTLVDPDGVVAAGRTFTGTWSCLYGAGPAVTGTFNLANGGNFTTAVGQILIGSVCTVAEDSATLTAPPKATDASYVWQAPSYAPAAIVTVTAAANAPLVTVTNTVTRLTGSFGVNKTVAGSGKAGGYVPGSTFPFTWSCVTPDGTVDGTFNLADGAAFPGPSALLPAGSVCTVTEGANPAPTSGDYSWDSVDLVVTGATGTPGPRSVTFTIPSQGAVSVAVTNTITRKLGSIVVNKVISGATGGLVGTPDFEITLSCGAAGTYVLQVPAGGSVSQGNLPIGTECSISEATPVGGLADASYAWGTATYQPATATVTGPPVQVTVTNPIERVKASVYIEKSFTGPAGIIDPAKVYTGTWTCLKGGVDVGSGTWSATAGTGQVLLSDDILVTAECSATENALSAPSADGSYRWLTPVITGTTVTAGGANKMTVANALTRDTGDITIGKELSGATAGYVGTGKPFTVRYTCVLDGLPNISGTVSIGAGGTETISGVPFGWLCSFTEDSPTQDLLKDASYAWGTPTIVPATVTLSNNNTGDSVVVTNPISRVYGAVNVTKILHDPSSAIKSGTVFSGGYSCVYDGQTPETGTWTITGAGTFVGRTDILVGSVCSITENALSASDLVNGSWAWNPPVFGADVTVTAGSPAVLTVTNSPKRLYAGLTVTKEVTGETAGLLAGVEFEGAWTCVLGSADWNGRFTVGGGQTEAIFTASDQLVPATAVCSIVEDTPDPADLVDGSYAFGTPTYTPASVTLVSGQSANLKVTNPIARVYGKLDIKKTVSGPGASGVDPARQFTGTVSCVYGSDPAVVLPWSTSAGVTATLSGILVGSVCTVAEDDSTTVLPPVSADPSYVWLAESVTPATATVGAPAAATTLVTVNNPTSRNYAGFSVEKKVTGAIEGITGLGGYPMSYSCVPATGSPITGTFTVQGGDTWTLPTDVDIPGGSECTVTEPAATLPALRDGAWSWDAPIFEVSVDGSTVSGRSVTFTLPAGSSENVEVVVTNNVTRTYGSFKVVKTSDPVTGSTVNPGSVVNYTVTLTSTGTVPVHDVVVTDDLSDVITNAVFNVSSVNAPAGTSTDFQVSNKKLIWNVGTLAADGVLVLTYSITINTDAIGVTLKNVVTATGDIPPSDCDPVDRPCSTEHHTPKWSVAKSSNPADGSTVLPGSEITYTLTVTNESAQAIARSVVVSDNLAQVLDNASFVGFVGASTGAAAPDTSGLLVWTVGDIAPSGSKTLSYTVKVNDDAVGVTLRNVITGNGSTPPEECTPADNSADGCSTEHYTPAWTIAKTANPATGSTVLPGDVVEYTVTVTNTSDKATAAGIIITDNLADVLDDAGDFTFVGSSAGALLVGNTLTWNVGTLAPSATKTLTYSVKVNAAADGITLRNVVSGTGSTPPQDCTVDEPCSTEHFSPSWTVTKTSDPASGSTVVPDQQITFTLTVSNTSDAPATNVVVTDDLSDVLPYATFDGIDAGYVGTATQVGNKLTWTIGAVPANTVRTLTYKVTVKAAAIGVTLKNAVTATGTTPPNECTENDPCVTEHFTPKWSVAKSANPADGSTVLPGDEITYTLTVTNESDDAWARSVAVSDNLANVLNNASFVGFVGTPAGVTAPGAAGVLSWTVGDVAPGATVSISYKVKVNADAIGVTLRNVVTGTGSTPPEECTPTDNSDADCSTEHYTPKWTVAKTSNPVSGSTVLPGDEITYTLTVTNQSAQAWANGVVITDSLADVLNNADMLTLAADLAADGAVLVGDTLTWTVGNVAPSGTATISYTVKVDAAAKGVTLKNVVTGDGDTPPQDCTATDPCSTEHFSPNWSIAKTSDPASGSTVVPGQVIEYTLTVTNSSDAVVNDIEVTDNLAGLLPYATIDQSSIVAAAGTSFDLQLSNSKLVWTVGTVAAHGTVTLTYSATVKADAVGVTLKNAVTGDGSTPPNECTSDDPCSTEHHTPKWSVAKSSSPEDGATVLPGQTITYTLTVTNESDQAWANGIIVRDDLSAVLNNAAYQGTVGSPAGVIPPNGAGVLVWNVGDLAPGGKVSISYTVKVKADAIGVTLRNVVTGTGSTPPEECTPTNATDADCSTEHYTPEWTIAKTSDPADGSKVLPGDEITYTLTVTNTTANADAGAVVITDNLANVLNNATMVTTAGDLAAEGAVLSGNSLVWTISSLDAGAVATLSYTVKVNAGAFGKTIGNVVTGTGSVPPETCVPGENNPSEDCSTNHYTPKLPQITKTLIGSPVQDSATGIWTIKYQVKVHNPNTADAVPYDLSDELGFASGVDIQTAAVTATPAGITANPAWDGQAVTSIVTGASIPANSDHLYEITVTAFVPVTVPDDIRGCGEQPAAGHGFFNSAEMVSYGTTIGDDDCGNIPEPAAVAVDKTVISTVQQADGSWTVTYHVTVTNSSDVQATQYTLRDTFAVGAGITINGTPTITGPSGVTVNPTWDGQADTLVVTNQLIAGGGEHVYTVTANATVSADATLEDRDCVVDEGEDGTGFLNRAQVNVGDREPTSHDACSTPVSPKIEKNFTSAEQNLDVNGDWDGTWTVKYAVTVTNESSTTGLVYSLTDTPDFPSLVTVNSATASGTTIAGDPITGLDNTWAAGTLSIITGHTLAAGGKDTYLVSFVVTVDPSLTPGTCEEGPAFRNDGTVYSGEDEFSDSDCGPITEVVVPLVTKTVATPTQMADGSWTIVYTIVVTNPSEGLAAKYDLSDTPTFGGDITINSAAVTSAPTGVDASAWNGDSQTTIVTGKSLAAGMTHTYQITINASVSATATQEQRDCTLTEVESGTGFLNSATVSVGDLTNSDDICAEPVSPTIEKSLAAVETTTTPGTYLVTYNVTVSNEDDSTGVQYSLEDELDFAAGVSVSGQSATASVVDLTGSVLSDVLTVNPSWTGIAPDIELTNGPTALAAGTRHVYTVSVLATVPVETPTEVLECNPQTPGGHGFFNSATISFGGDSEGPQTDDASACGDIPVRVQVDKIWIIDGVTFDEGAQPEGFEATPTLDGDERAWGTVYDGYALGATVTVGENVSTPNANCVALPGEGLGDLVLTGALTTKTITNVVDCATTLTLVKEVNAKNGGEATAQDWTLQATDAGGVTFDGLGSASGSVIPGVTYGISELPGPAGWQVDSTWSCVNSLERPVAFTADEGSTSGTVVLGYGDDVVCTIVNTDFLIDMAVTIDNAETGDHSDRTVVTKSGVNAQYDYIINVTNVGSEPATGVKVENGVEPYLKVDPTSLRIDGVSTSASGLRTASMLAAATNISDWTITLTGTDANGFGGVITATYAGTYLPGDTAEISYTVTVGTVPSAADGSYIDIPSKVVVSALERESTYANNVDTVLTPVEYIQVEPSTSTNTPTPTTETTTTTVTTTTTTSTPVYPTKPLPNTGVPAETMGYWGLGLLLAGGLFLAIGMRRRRSGEGGSHI